MLHGVHLHHFALIILIGSFPLLNSCATTIVPPTHLKQSERVALLDHGRHSSLILPDAGGKMIRYSYGDWQYYALEKTGVLQGSAALFWPSQACLGRRVLTGPVSPENIRHRVVIGIEKILLIHVEGKQIQDLRDHLDGIYMSNQETLIYNPAYDLEFVHHPDPYWIFHNSNQVIGKWLEKLGCSLQGLSLFSDWKVVDRPGIEPATR